MIESTKQLPYTESGFIPKYAHYSKIGRNAEIRWTVPGRVRFDKNGKTFYADSEDVTGIAAAAEYVGLTAKEIKEAFLEISTEPPFPRWAWFKDDK